MPCWRHIWNLHVECHRWNILHIPSHYLRNSTEVVFCKIMRDGLRRVRAYPRHYTSINPLKLCINSTQSSTESGILKPKNSTWLTWNCEKFHHHSLSQFGTFVDTHATYTPSRRMSFVVRVRVSHYSIKRIELVQSHRPVSVIPNPSNGNSASSK